MNTYMVRRGRNIKHERRPWLQVAGEATGSGVESEMCLMRREGWQGDGLRWVAMDLGRGNLPRGFRVSESSEGIRIREWGSRIG